MPTQKKKEEQSIVFTTEIVNDIINKENKGLKTHRDEKLWLKNETNVRRPGIKFSMTDEELKEYTMCKLSVHYFAEKYCKIKKEDGSVGEMRLRDYQKEIIDLYTKNRYSILMASRQVGKCIDLSTYVYMLDEKTGEKFTLPLFELYFSVLKTERKLTTLEKIKYFLYKIYEKI